MYCKLTITCYASKTLVLKSCRMYNIFGSGSTHAAHAQFMVQSAVDNNGRKIGLSRGATSRMASWFYAQLRMLRLRHTLEATIAQKKFRDLTLRENEKLAVQDIMNPLFGRPFSPFFELFILRFDVLGTATPTHLPWIK